MPDTKKMLGKKMIHFKKIYKVYSSDYFFSRVIFFHSFIKNVFMKIKSSIFPPKFTRLKKNIEQKIVYPRKIYNFGPAHFFIGIISFLS